MGVDRASRDRLAEAVYRFLGEKSTAFDLDEVVAEVLFTSDDPTVEYVIFELWGFYDDYKDHAVALPKEGWDYLHRLILLLKSDAHIELEKRRNWSFSQFVAAAALALFGLCMAWFGIGYHVIALVILFGLVSILLSCWRERSARELTPGEIALIPFSSVSEMLAIRRSVPRFTKHRYPPHLKSRRIRSPLMDAAMYVPMYSLWLGFSPIALLVQSFPETETQARLRPSP